MLCSVCENIQYDELDTGYAAVPGYLHHKNYSELESCADCDFCKVINTNIINAGLEKHTLWQEQQIYLRLIPSSTGIGDESEKSNLFVSTRPSADGGNETYLSFFGLFLARSRMEVEDGKPDPKYPAALGGRPVSSFSGSDDCFKLANRWLDECVGKDRSNPDKQHSHVLPDVDEALLPTYGRSGPRDMSPYISFNQTFMPSRTIDVGPPDSNGEVRLVSHAPGEAPQQWVTLSHCWGNSIPIKTTLDTLPQWQEGIPAFLLPPSFRDAVLITRKLGIRHLWIDSLCIIQDSKDDWSRESVRMGDVYKYGILNIAASAASGCQDGILNKRVEPEVTLALPFNSQKHPIKSKMYIRSGRWDLMMREVFGPDSTLSPRAWCLQETILSPRTLHYSQKQMFWECSHCTLAESIISPIAIIGTYNLMHGWTSNKMIMPGGIAQKPLEEVIQEKDSNKRTQLYDSWLEIMSNYSKRRLTFHSDVFAALAGAASIYQAHLGDKYLAGLFEGDLLRNLLWRSSDDRLIIATSPKNCPSWTWASVIGGVQPEIVISSSFRPPRIVGELTAQVLCAETYLDDGDLAPPNHLLDVCGGQLMLEGHLLRGASLSQLRYEGENIDSIRGDPAKPNTVKHSRFSLYPDVAQDLDNPDDVAIFHLGVWEWDYGKHQSNSNETGFAGLVLRATDETRSTYQRIGIAVMRIATLEGEDYRFRGDIEKLMAEKWEKTVVTIV